MTRERGLSTEEYAVLGKLPIDETIYGISDFPEGIATDRFYFRRRQPIGVYVNIRAREQHVAELRKRGMDTSHLFEDRKQLCLEFRGVNVDIDINGSYSMSYLGGGRTKPEDIKFVENLINNQAFLDIAGNMISERFKEVRS